MLLGMDTFPMSTPLRSASNHACLNHPLQEPFQSLIHPKAAFLGMHAIKNRLTTHGDEVVGRPMIHLALSYDRRLENGAEGVLFLKRNVECIEEPTRLMFEV